jgi:histidyl-tRNA synthetase
MTETKLITPRKLSGFMELLPSKQMVLDKMIDKIKGVYQKFAFMPLDTPVLELSEILLAKSGGEIDKELYNFKKGDTDICMRYDLTVPLARFVAMNSENLTFPFKRYQIGKVFRGERAQKGRFREFIQCDADIIGIDTLPIIADAECLNIADKVFDALGLKIVNHISNRNILFGYCEGLGLKDKTIEILITLDKLGKIGKDNAIEELISIGATPLQAEQLINLTTQCGSFEDVIKNIENLCDSEVYKKGIDELKELSSYLTAYGLDENNYVLDIGIIRGHNYYTGTVFEAIIPDHPEFGAVCSGGRYDNLAGYYTTKKMPGVGLSIGLTRLFDLLDKNDMLENCSQTNIDLQIIPLGDTLLKCLELQKFFQTSIVCDVNYDNRSFKGKMKEANKREIPFILVVGENEVASEIYSLKNMLTGTQYNLSKEECLKTILETK